MKMKLPKFAIGEYVSMTIPFRTRSLVLTRSWNPYDQAWDYTVGQIVGSKMYQWSCPENELHE